MLIDQAVTIHVDMLAKLLNGKNFIQAKPCNIENKVSKSKPPSTSNLGVKTWGQITTNNASKKPLIIIPITTRSKDK
jgi:hypothetical protein